MDDERWLITRYKFKEGINQYEHDGSIMKEDNEHLLAFIKDVIAPSDDKYRWHISYVVNEVDDNDR